MPIYKNPGLPPAIEKALKHNLGARFEELLIPPPVFVTLKGKFLDYDPDSASLTTKFPVFSDYLNPYGTLQGGIIAALIDNTIGPLSVIVAPPNVTRFLELKYSKPVTPETEELIIYAQLLNKDESYLTFKAIVRDPHGRKITTAKAIHYILPDEEKYV